MNKITTAQALGKTFPHPIFEYLDTVAFLVGEGFAFAAGAALAHQMRSRK